MDDRGSGRQFCHAPYEWTTGVPDNGIEWRKLRVVRRSRSLRPLVLYCVFLGWKAFRLPGEGGDHFHCAVEGHIRCQIFAVFWALSVANLLTPVFQTADDYNLQIAISLS